MLQPFIQIGLQRVDVVIELLSKRNLAELLQVRLVETTRAWCIEAAASHSGQTNPNLLGYLFGKNRTVAKVLPEHASIWGVAFWPTTATTLLRSAFAAALRIRCIS
jgi:hypothetical protein